MCRITELMEKEVISLEDGQSLGRVCDAEIDTCEQRLCALIIFGRLKFLGLLGREDDIIIKWEDIELIGEDTILVKKCCGCSPKRPKRKRRLL